MFIEAFEAIWERRARATLCCAGVMIGMVATITIVAVGDATTGAINGIVSGLQDGTFFVHPDDRMPNHTLGLLTVVEINRLWLADRNIKAAFPAQRILLRVKHGHDDAMLDVAAAQNGRIGTAGLYLGRSFSAQDISSSARVAILSYAAAEKLGVNNIIGETIRLNQDSYEVIGIMNKPGKGLLNIDFTSPVQIPYSTMENRYLRYSKSGAEFVVKNLSHLQNTQAEVLSELHQLHPMIVYQVEKRSDITHFVARIVGTITYVLLAISFVAVAVAGTGSSTVMLSSVMSRTKEIGIRRAIGATRTHIVLQFLLESLMLSFIGVLAGTIVGIACGIVSDDILIARISGMLPPFPYEKTLLWATCSSLVMGVGFGILPALRAASIEPSEAIRYEN